MIKSLTDEHTEILRLLNGVVKAVGIETITSQLSVATSKRTAQRRVQELVNRGYIEKIGNARATRYQLTESARDASEEQNEVRHYEEYIPLSPASLEILRYVRQPKQARHLVNYDRTFLENYEPNKSFYLDESTRRHLHLVGDTGESEQPIGTYGRGILDRLLIDLSWSSSKLEGNTYTRLDTEKLIQEGREAEGKAAQDAQMILNHKRAIELIVDDAEEVGFNRFSFLNLHGLLSENLLADQSASGRVRVRGVDISGSVYKPCDITQVIEDMFHLILLKASQIKDPFEQAFFIMVHIPYLQPFEDVNKRVSRVGANIAFIQKNLCPLTFMDVPAKAYIESLLGVYEMNRVELFRDLFIWAYERSTKKYIQVKDSLEEPEPVRLKYRNELHELVGNVIREKIYPYDDHIRKTAVNIIANESDCNKFIMMVKEDIKRLHEGVLVRYSLKASEYNEWRKLLSL